MPLLPAKLPAIYVHTGSSGTVVVDQDTGGYDVMIGGYGFRFANSKEFPYSRVTEQSTTRRFDSSLEPGEQSLAALPWIKAQSSFHAGAGQLNLEQGFTAFQYQQEQIEHIRYDNSLGIDPWTPGQVTRLPDVKVTSTAFDASHITTGMSGATDYVVCGGVHALYQGTVNTSGVVSLAAVDLTGVSFGGASNCTVLSLSTDGVNYYALISLGTAVSGKTGYVVKGALNSTAAPTCLYDLTATTVVGVVGWSKARLVAGLGASFYSLDTNATAHSALPTTANYTHPVAGWTWTDLAESPNGILGSGNLGGHASILEFTLDTSGAAPTLSGGAVVVTLPVGEVIYAIKNVVGSFLAVGSSAGIRVGTFDTYTGALKMGPLSVDTTSPVYAVTTRDRFVYGSYSNQQADGTTGLVAVDVSMLVDATGRNAYAPSLRPPTTAATKHGNVLAVDVLPATRRIIWYSTDGLHVEGTSAGSDGDAWLRTSRIRYDTSEPKLFKLARLHGTLDVANIQVTGIAPFQADQNLGTFGFTAPDPGEFRLPSGLHEWIQLKFDLQGSACVFNTYQVKAIPAPKRQHIITFTVNCFVNEVDKDGLDVTDPQLPRDRYLNVKALEEAGEEIRLVEFTNSGAVAELVVVDQLAYQSYDRPTPTDDFGGYITFVLRSTES